MKRVRVGKGLYLNKLSKKEIAALREYQKICERFGIMVAKISLEKEDGKKKK